MENLGLFNVRTVEKQNEWEVTYWGKGEAMGGPLIIGVDKETGRTRLIGGGQ